MASPYPRRSSYASVAAGNAPSGQLLFSPSAGATSTSQQGADFDSSDSTPPHLSTLRPAGIAEVEGSKPSILKNQAFYVENAYNPSKYAMPHPSYLRKSRYFQQLEAQTMHNQRLAREEALAQQQQQQQQQQRRMSGLGSRQSSSTNLALHKPSNNLPTSKGIVHDVIERLPPLPPEGEIKQLPTRWNELDKCPGLELLSNGLEVKYQGGGRTPDDAATVRSDNFMPRECGLYYYEVTVLSRGKEGLIGVGFSGSRPSLNRLPGWEQESWGYHGDDGNSFNCSHSGKTYGPKFSALDVVGCGVNFRTGTAFFTKNGTFLGDAFHGLKVERLYPSIGIKKPGEHIRANFGQSPFVYDIDTMMERERRIVQGEIAAFDISSTPLIKGYDETATINELVSQYLAHEGLIQTANAFAAEVQAQHQSLHPSGVQLPPLSEPDDYNAVQRQKIRSSILDGDIDRTFKYLETYFPHVFDRDSNRDIYFRLRCRKFIEMILRSYETKNVRRGVEGDEVATNGATNGHNGTAESNGMDIDEAEPPALTNGKAAAVVGARDTGDDDILTEVIQYGMELQADFGNDPRKEVKKALSDTFALIAYTDARHSVLSDLVEGKGRVEIAEEVNGAILVSLGKPRSALLEKLCGQTEVLLDLLAQDGGVGAFANVRDDYLH